MSLKKIKTTGEYRFGKEYIYSLCNVKFDENGEAEVPEEHIKGLLERDSRLYVENEVPESDYEKELIKMKKEELVELAKEIKGYEETMNKKDIVSLILKSMNEENAK